MLKQVTTCWRQSHSNVCPCSMAGEAPLLAPVIRHDNKATGQVRCMCVQVALARYPAIILMALTVLSRPS